MVKMLAFTALFHIRVVFWTCFYVGIALDVPNIVSGWRKHQPNIVVFVDPLDDYGATSEVRTTCASLGLRVVNMWSPQVSRKLLSYLEQSGEVTIELAGVSVDINDILDGTYTAPLLYQSNDAEHHGEASISSESSNDSSESPNEVDRYTQATDQAMAWLTHQDINVTEVLGVVCESDVGLRTAEEFAASLLLPTANSRCEVVFDPFSDETLVVYDMHPTIHPFTLFQSLILTSSKVFLH